MCCVLLCSCHHHLQMMKVTLLSYIMKMSDSLRKQKRCTFSWSSYWETSMRCVPPSSPIALYIVKGPVVEVECSLYFKLAYFAYNSKLLFFCDICTSVSDPLSPFKSDLKMKVLRKSCCLLYRSLVCVFLRGNKRELLVAVLTSVSYGTNAITQQQILCRWLYTHLWNASLELGWVAQKAITAYVYFSLLKRFDCLNVASLSLRSVFEGSLWSDFPLLFFC